MPERDLKDEVLDTANEMLNMVGNHSNVDERGDIIGICIAQIIQNVAKIATTTEQGFIMIDEITTELKQSWAEVREAS